MKEKMREIIEWIKGRNELTVVGHIDADGLCATAVMLKALEREEKKTSFKNLRQLYPKEIKELREKKKFFVFVDFGSGQMDLLKKELREGEFAVIDHHQPIEGEEYSLHLNPFFYGMDGGREVSGAGMSYLLAREMNKENRDLSVMAVVGAIGDMQEGVEGLSGMNKEILEEAVKEGLVKKEKSLKMFGRVSRPLVQFLLFSTNPILPELTANEENCIKFLKENGIELREGKSWRSYEDLGEEEKKRLASALIIHLIQNGFSERKANELIGEVYTLVKEELKSPLRDAKEFSTLLNACGRHSMGEIGVKVCLGDRGEYYRKALNLLLEHRKQLREGLELIERNGLAEERGFYYFDAGNAVKEELVGVIAGMLYGSRIELRDKPIIAFAREREGKGLKVSGRATNELAEKGINLGKILREVCGELSEESVGGGHKQAAGAKIKEEEKKEFLRLLNEKIREYRKDY
ncbi:MAG: DHH family phosphoesterase [archaeon]